MNGPGASLTMRVAPVSETGRDEDAAGSRLAEAVAGPLDAGADLVLLPQLTFHPYFPQSRDRSALEHGERMPSGRLEGLLDGLDRGHVFASPYECVGEGVFYIRGELTGPGLDRPLVFDRQRRIEATPGRYEQMFSSPGHGPRPVGGSPWGPAGILLGADAADPSAYAELAANGARLIVGGTSFGEEAWERTARLASAMAAAHRVAVALVNRGGEEPGFAGGSVITGADGAGSAPGQDGLHELEVPSEESE